METQCGAIECSLGVSGEHRDWPNSFCLDLDEGRVAVLQSGAMHIIIMWGNIFGNVIYIMYCQQT